MKIISLTLACALLSSCTLTKPTALTEGGGEKTKIYNLVILDQSGSMSSIEKQAVSGYNETVQTIQSAQKKYAAQQEHYVTLVLFNSDGTKIVYNNAPSAKAEELSSRSYKPSGMTPLYDAMGLSLNKARQSINEKEKHKVLVTIITDGEENFSSEYNARGIKKLVDDLKERDWTFVYIGANQNVLEQARKISTGNSLSFEAAPAPVMGMFKKKNASRASWYGRVADQEDAKSLQKNFFKNSSKKD